MHKRSRRHQNYSRAKLFTSIYAAFVDISGKQSTVDAVTDTIEAKILDSARNGTISTSEIAGIALQTLKHYNTAAFVRYLSNQTDLASEAQLRKELKKY